MYKTRVSMIVLLAAFASADIAESALINSYDFNGDLTDTLGNGVDLTASGGTVSGGRYSFTANQGLRLTSALPSTTDYGIEIKLQMNDGLSGFNKLIDFQDLASDFGLYVHDAALQFTDFTPKIGSVSLNTDFTVGLARFGGSIELFLNGSSVFNGADSGTRAVPFSNILNFFEDDINFGKKESFIGSVDFIRIHDDSSTFGTDPNVIPEPSTFCVWALLGIVGASVHWRRRRKAA